MTGLLQTAFGTANITIASSADNATAYDAVWLDQRWTAGSLTAPELAQLSAFVATGRRMVLIGENSRGTKSWASWDSQILGLLSGALAGNSEELAYQTASPVTNHELTQGVGSVTLINDGLTSGGLSLFNQSVASLWGVHENVLTWMSINMQDDNYIGYTDNRQFAGNVAYWLADGPVHAPEPSTYALFGAGLVGLALLRWRARNR
jgi:hypothetical protein